MATIAYAKQKVLSIIETLNSIRELDFPYKDSLAAVKSIQVIFEAHLKHLNDEVSDENAARALCGQITIDMDVYLAAIGFIERASHIRGPLELQGPLLRLTHKAIGDHVGLIVSSEWRYSPFTWVYPESFGDKFVFVGLPVSEATNPLIVPLAGHELGHNIWSRLPDLQLDVFDLITNAVTKLIKEKHWEKYSDCFNLTDKSQLDNEEISGLPTPRQTAISWCISQCEEIFCDFVGLYIFGEGYLHAFQYLISPGGKNRNTQYPSTKDRVNMLVAASKEYGLQIPLLFAAEFVDHYQGDLKQQLLLTICDSAVQEYVTELMKLAQSYCDLQGLNYRDQREVERIVAMFKNVTPASGTKGLANIINAAWQMFLVPDNHWETSYPKATEKPEQRVRLLQELVLKSFEVFEIEQIQRGGNNAVISA